jgi:hypothetical protein
VLNHVDLGQPQRDISDITHFGQISSVASTARQLQLAAKFIF